MTAVAARHGRERARGAADRRRRPGVRAARPGVAAQVRRRGAPSVHRARGGAAGSGTRGPSGGPAAAVRLTPSLVPDEADLVIVGNPTNPTSVRTRRESWRRWPGRAGSWSSTRRSPTRSTGPSGGARSRPGATCPGSSSFAASPRPGGWPGCGSGTCSPHPSWWLGSAQAQPLWAVSTPALAATVACAAPAALAEERAWAADLAADRAHLVAGLSALPGIELPAPIGQLLCPGADPRRDGDPSRPCGSAALRCAAVTRFPGSARTGCGSRSVTRPPRTRSCRPRRHVERRGTF